MEQVGLAIVGSTGVIGKTHIEAIGQLSSCRLVGVNARRQEPLVQQASELGVKAYPTLVDVLSDSEVDAIVIATPHPSHRDITIQAVEAGKHVLAEKPMSVTPSEADDMVEAARHSGATLGVLFNNLTIWRLERGPCIQKLFFESWALVHTRLSMFNLLVDLQMVAMGRIRIESIAITSYRLF